MKKRLYKAFRRARRKVAQYIVGFDRCPTDCKRNRKNESKALISMLALTACVVGGLMLIALFLG
jgi:hypothetical protein